MLDWIDNLYIGHFFIRQDLQDFTGLFNFFLSFRTKERKHNPPSPRLRRDKSIFDGPNLLLHLCHTCGFRWDFYIIPYIFWLFEMCISPQAIDNLWFLPEITNKSCQSCQSCQIIFSLWTLLPSRRCGRSWYSCLKKVIPATMLGGIYNLYVSFWHSTIFNF